MRASPVSLLVVLLAAACGEDDVTSTDAGRADAGTPGADAGRFEVAAPAEPMPPVLTPCPAGWVELADETAGARCEPFGGAPSDCTGASAHFPSGTGCERVGSECPADGLPAVPAGTDALYVRAGAPAGGDGSRAAPFRRIAEALAVASASTVVAVGIGTYDEALVPPAGVRIVGACAEQTILTSSTPDPNAGVIHAVAPGVTVEDVSIVSSVRPGIVVAGDAATLALASVVIDRASEQGLLAWDGGSFAARRLVVRDTQPGGTGPNGDGVALAMGATGSIESGMIEGNHHTGLFADDATLTLSDVAVVDTGTDTRAPDDGGRAIQIQNGATATIRRSVLAGAEGWGLVLGTFVNTGAELEDVVIRDVAAHPTTGEEGHAIRMLPGTSLTARRVLVENVRSHGLFAQGAESVVLEDAIIRDVSPRASNDQIGRGIGLEEDTAAELSRVVVERVHEVGIVVLGAGGSLIARDLRVRDVESQIADGRFGRGVQIQGGATLDAERMAIERAREIALGVSDGTVTLRDVRVADVRARPLDSDWGWGVGVWGASTITAERLWVDGARDIGVGLLGEAVELDATSLHVSGTARADCGDTTCVPTGNGHALAVGAASVRVRDVVLEGSTVCGLLVAHGGELDLVQGEVRDNEIGACVQVMEYDLARLMNDVAYRDNGLSLDATELPVPEVPDDT